MLQATRPPASHNVAAERSSASGPLICFSHLRWDFVLQRPQHLMERFSRSRRVFFFEEFIPTDHHLAYLEYHPFEGTEVIAVRPRVPHWWSEARREEALAGLLKLLVRLEGGHKPVLWFYTPMMYAFARTMDAAAIVYDCMDELANFRFAPDRLKELEQDLMRAADVVFTGGDSLYEAKRHAHDNIHPFPSSVDVAHFAAARDALAEPADQADIPRPRIGFYGVIDERMDLGLIAAVADRRPHISFVMVGPVVKIDPADLPRRPNIHYPGKKNYSDLPAYLAGWDAAMMPFAVNEATRFISPTKTPEYLAAGRPVVSTPIADVVRSYGALEAVEIADDAESFAAACDAVLRRGTAAEDWRAEADAMLARQSWDATLGRMDRLVAEAVGRNEGNVVPLHRPSIRRPNGRKPYDVLVVGAGFAGSVMAERMAREAGKRVLVVDRRAHIAGNAFDHRNEAGLLVHRYGPHIFHTNSDEIFAYLSRFTAWRPYEHRVLAAVGERRVPMPINRTTLNMLYGAGLADDAAAQRFLAARAVGSLEATGSDHPFLAEVGDAASLHRAMAAALADAGAVRRATETLHRRFRQEFHSSRMGAQTRALYDGLAARRGMRSPKGRSMNRTRIGFIGAGGIANRHLGVLERFEDVELAAFCDSDFTRASGAAGRFGARAFADHRAMLEAERLDAVYVCVPPFAHGAIEHDVIEAGLPFFVEKPVSLDLATARGIETAAAAAGLVTAVGYHWRYLDTLDEARELFAKNPVRLLSGYWLDATPPPTWWWKQDGSGGQMVEQATHILDLCRVLAGEIDTVFGLASHIEREDFPGLDVATASTASLSFANGAVGNIAATCLLRWNHRVGLHLFADGLAMEITDRDIMIDVGRGRPVRRAEGDPVAREDRDFIDAVQGKPNRIRCPYGEAVRTHEVALAIGRSAASGKPVALSRAHETVHEKAYA